jgi:hypothetical protein
MKFFLLFFIICNTGFTLSFDDINIYGNTSYSKQSSESLVTSFTMEYKIKLHEPNDKKYMIYAGGSISPDYDHFGKTIKVNSFTNLGIEF